MEIRYIESNGERFAEFTYGDNEMDSGYVWLVLGKLQKLGYVLHCISTQTSSIMVEDKYEYEAVEEDFFKVKKALLNYYGEISMNKSKMTTYRMTTYRKYILTLSRDEGRELIDDIKLAIENGFTFKKYVNDIYKKAKLWEESQVVYKNKE